MVWVDYLVALHLLTAPPEALNLRGDPGYYAGLRSTLQQVCVQWEVLDPREVRYVLMRPEDFISDLNLLRRRYLDLADAPSLHDCERFPERELINDFLSFNRTYRQYLGARQPVDLARW